MRKLLLISVALLVLALFIGTTAQAQLGSGTLSGVVNDDQGQAVPGVTVTAKNVDTGWSRIDITSENGAYRIPSVPFGTYDVTAELASFATQVKTGIRVDVGRTISVNFEMRLSSTAEVIEVTGETPLIEKTESHVATIVTPEQVENLPLNLRQFANLGVLAPATSLKVNNDPTRPSNLAVSLVGGSGRNMNTTIDGGDNNDDTIGGINQFFPLSAIAEFNFLTNRYKAEYGRSNGGILNVVTKSGTNNMHGSFFANFRNDSLNSVTRTEENAGLDEPSFYSREQFGGAAGGPIVKDRAHFFVAVERAQTDQQTQIDSAGIFPDLDGTISDVPLRETLFTGKGTVNIDPRQFLTVRYGQQKTEATYNAAPNYAPSAQGVVTNTFHSFLASHNYVVSENMLNEFLFQFADFKDVITPNSNDPTESFPNGFYVGQSASLPQSTFQDKYQFKDDFSWTMGGNHHFKTGINFVHEPTLGGTFSNNVGIPSFTHIGNSAGSPISSIFINGPETGSNESPNDQYGIYFQDDWNVNQKLTLNLGIRYDYVSGFDINQSSNALFPALKSLPNDFPWLQAFKDSSDGSLQNDKNNIAPRIGAAYDWNGDGVMIFRGGYGRYFDFPYTNANILFPLIALEGFGQVYFAEDPNGIRNSDGSFFQVGDPLPENQLPPGGAAVANDIASPDFVVPYSDQFSAGVSRQFDENSAIDVDYIHVRFRDQFLRFRANGNINGVDILPQFGNFRVWYNGGFSDYDAVSVTYRRRVTKGFQFHAAYTLSRAEGNTLPGSDEFRLALPANIGNCRDCALDFKQDIADDPQMVGPLDTDARHRVVVAATVDLPADFQISGFLRANSAIPYNAFVVEDLDGDGFAYSITDGHVNSRRGDPFSQLDIRLSKIFRVGDAVDIEGIFEVFNVFNAENPAKFRGDQNSSLFGTARGFAGDPDQGEQRLAQLGFRVEF